MQDRGPAAYIAEFIGTLLLVFFITAGVSLFVTSPSPQNPAPFIDFGVLGLIHFFVLFMLVQGLAIVSGAHFNPAVTVAMTALRQIKPPDAVIYIVAQLAGAVAGAFLTKLLLNEFGNADAVNFGAVAVSASLDGKHLAGHARRVHRHVLPRAHDRRRGRRPARGPRARAAGDRRRAGPRR